MDNNQNRYTKQEQLPEISKKGQTAICNTHVAVVGCGGLGCFVAQSLVGLGIGKLTLIDNDTVVLSNLHRQLLYQEKHIGLSKAITAKECLLKNNSAVVITAHTDRLVAANAATLLKDAMIVVDCTDNVASRIHIDTYCNQKKIPMVFGGVKGFEGQVAVFNYLRGKSFQESFDTSTLLQHENCNDSGVMPYVAAITANLQVNEIIKIIINAKDTLQGYILYFNCTSYIFRKIKI